MVYWIPGEESVVEPKPPSTSSVKNAAVKWLSGIQLVLAFTVFLLQIPLIVMGTRHWPPYSTPTVYGMNAHKFGLIVGAVGFAAAVVSILAANLKLVALLLALISHILGETGLILFLVSITHDMSQVGRRHENFTSRGLLTVATVTGSLLSAIFSLLTIILIFNELWKIKKRILRTSYRMRMTNIMEKDFDGKSSLDKVLGVPFRNEQARIIGWSQLAVAAVLCVAQMPMSGNGLPWKIFEFLAVASFVLIVHWATITQMTYFKLIGFIAFHLGSAIGVLTILITFGIGNSYDYPYYNRPQGFLISFGILLMIQSGVLIAMGIEPIFKVEGNKDAEAVSPLSIGVEVNPDEGKFVNISLQQDEKPKESESI